MRTVQNWLKRIWIVVNLILTGNWQELLIGIGAYLDKKLLRLRGLDFGRVSLDQLGLSPEHSVEHAVSAGRPLKTALHLLNIGPTDTIIDMGCGKGGAMFVMTQFPFARVAGLDISEDLLQIARRNFTRLGIDRIKLFCEDAEKFTNLDDYNYIYFFNPFPCTVMQSVMAHICDSLIRVPRRLTIIYMNPRCEDVILSSGTFVKTHELFPATYGIHIYVHSEQDLVIVKKHSPLRHRIFQISQPN